MMFLCLCWFDVEAFETMSTEEGAALGPACAPHDAALRATGSVTALGSLAMPADAVHFVPTDGAPERRAGAYLEGRHQPGAFFLVEADSVEVAVQVASKHPAANIGGRLGFAVEVRACEMFTTDVSGGAPGAA